jgi:antitoxin (DNA-binding transcriptional repressor) of toxin-antitoxin stability system
MNAGAATIRELRKDLRSVKRKIEKFGKVTITDRGEPAYVIKPWPRASKTKATTRDYYARLLKRQPNPLSQEETRRFWEGERG